MWMVRQGCFLNTKTVKLPFATHCPKSQLAGPWVAWYIMALALSRWPVFSWACPSDLSSCLLMDIYLEGCRKAKTCSEHSCQQIRDSNVTLALATGQHHARMEAHYLSGFSFPYRKLYKPRNRSNRKDSTFSLHTKRAGSSSLWFMPKMKIFTIIKWLHNFGFFEVLIESC